MKFSLLLILLGTLSSCLFESSQFGDECDEQDDCGSPLICVQNQCRLNACEEGLCGICSDDFECGELEICDEGDCIQVDCKNDNDCFEGGICENNQCFFIDDCRNLGCEEGRCDENTGICEPLCSQDIECELGESCDEGICVNAIEIRSREGRSFALGNLEEPTFFGDLCPDGQVVNAMRGITSNESLRGINATCATVELVGQEFLLFEQETIGNIDETDTELNARCIDGSFLIGFSYTQRSNAKMQSLVGLSLICAFPDLASRRFDDTLEQEFLNSGVNTALCPDEGVVSGFDYSDDDFLGFQLYFHCSSFFR